MNRSPLIVGLAGVFAGMTVLLVILAAVFGELLVFLIALPFAGATYLFWQHASGRLRERVRNRAQRARQREATREQFGDDARGGFGAGPRFGDANTRFGREARQAGARAGGRTRQGQRIDPTAPGGPSRREAYETLGLSPDADEAAVRRAYRKQVKETHPDRGGDEERFK